MTVEVHTDASCVEGFCGYAFWITSDEGSIQKAGKLKSTAKDPTLCEIMCIANALYTLKKQGYTTVEKIKIHTDSMSCRSFLTNTSASRNTEIRKVTEECYFLMLELCIKNGKGIRDVKSFINVKYVKAHTKSKDKQSLANKWCDEESRKYARLQFEQSKIKK